MSHFTHEMTSLYKRWENKLEILIRDSETRDRVARVREAQPAGSMAPTIAPVPDSTSQRKSEGKPKKLGPSEQKRLRVNFGAIQANLKGPRYCRELDQKHLPIPNKWIEERCPPTYSEAYRQEKWRQYIQNEKSKYKVKYLAASPAEREALIQQRAAKSPLAALANG